MKIFCHSLNNNVYEMRKEVTCLVKGTWTICTWRRLKVKIKFSLCLTKQHAMKTYWGSGGIAPPILDFDTRWGEWSASCPGHFTSGEGAPVTHWIGGWVGRRAGLNAEKFPAPTGNRTPKPRSLLREIFDRRRNVERRILPNYEIRKMCRSPGL